MAATAAPGRSALPRRFAFEDRRTDLRAMVATGRARQIHPLVWALVPLFAAFFASDWLLANVF